MKNINILTSELLRNNSRLQNSQIVNGINWSCENFNEIIQGSYSFNDNKYFGQVFGRAYNYELLISTLPHNLTIPSADEWRNLILSFNSNVFDLSFRGYSGFSLHPIGFHRTSDSEQVITHSSVLYWSSTTKGKNQIAVALDFLYNKFDFIKIPKDWSIGARIIVK